jgi:hypothetical protein
MKGSNMKRFIASVIAVSMLVSTPVYAGDRWKDRDYSHQERRKSKGCGWLCGAIIGGVVVGAISSSERERKRNREREYDNRYYPPEYTHDRRYCVREQITEWYRGEKYVYWQTTCN